MAPSRPAASEPTAPPPPKPRRSAAATARREPAVERQVAEMLRDLRTDGKALSAEIGRLRHRFL